jgi:hypothetical protein
MLLTNLAQVIQIFSLIHVYKIGTCRFFAPYFRDGFVCCQRKFAASTFQIVDEYILVTSVYHSIPYLFFFLQKMLIYDPAKRISARAALKH